MPHPRPINLARRIERAVRMNVTDKYSSVPYQVTSYGLGESDSVFEAEG